MRHEGVVGAFVAGGEHLRAGLGAAAFHCREGVGVLGAESMTVLLEEFGLEAFQPLAYDINRFVVMVTP